MHHRDGNSVKLQLSESKASAFALPGDSRFDRELNYINATQKTAQIFGGLNNLITLSHTHIYSSKVRAIERRTDASRYGFSCEQAREAVAFFVHGGITRLKIEN